MKQDKIDFVTFELRAQEMIKRLAVIDELFVEADNLIISLDTSNLNDDQLEEAWTLAYEMASPFGAALDSFEDGMWMPSSC